MSSRRSGGATLRAVLTIVAALALAWAVGGAARAQGQPQPPPMPGGQPRPLPAGQQQLPPGHPPIGNPPPGARQVQPGQLPPGMRPPGMPPAHPPAPAAHEAEHAEAEHCPGHGPLDPPPHINWWHGLIGVNNDKAAEGGSALDRLLWRYENPDNPCDERNEPPPFLASLINFGVLAYVVYRFGKKPLANALVKRKQTIMQEIENAARLKRESKARLRDYRRKFENIEETLEEMKAEFAAQAALDKKRMLAEAEERRERMRRDAEFRIEQELKAAQIALMQEAVQAAVAAAEELLKSRLEPADLDRSAEDYLRSLGAAMTQPGAPARSRPVAPPRELGGVS